MSNKYQKIAFKYGYAEVFNWGIDNNLDIFEQKHVDPNYKEYVKKFVRGAPVVHSCYDLAISPSYHLQQFKDKLIKLSDVKMVFLDLSFLYKDFYQS